jgi:type I restriction enzyme, S subunit
MSFEATMTLRDFVSLQRGTTYKGNLLGLPGPVLLGLASIQANGGFRRGSFKTYGGECPAKITLKPGEMYVSLKDVTQSGDLLGSVARLPLDITAGRLTQDTVKLNFDGKPISQNYVYWLLRTPFYREYCRARGTGTTTLGLGRDDFLEFPVPEPDSTVLSLVQLLDVLDDRISLLRETNATLKAIAQALFKSWFVDFDPVRAKQEGRTPEGMGEETAALFPDTFEVSGLGPIPKGWRVAKVEEIMELAYGKALKASDRIPGSVPVYGSGGVTGNHSQALVVFPSIIIGRKGTVGSLYWEDRPFFPIDTVFYVRTHKPLTYCFYQLACLGLEGMNTDGAVPGLNRNNVYRLRIVLPPDEVLSAFDAVAAVLRHKIRNGMEQINLVSALRDTLLSRLVTGQLRLPEVGAQPRSMEIAHAV